MCEINNLATIIWNTHISLYFNIFKIPKLQLYVKSKCLDEKTSLHCIQGRCFLWKRIELKQRFRFNKGEKQELECVLGREQPDWSMLVGRAVTLTLLRHRPRRLLYSFAMLLLRAVMFRWSLKTCLWLHALGRWVFFLSGRGLGRYLSVS